MDDSHQGGHYRNADIIDLGDLPGADTGQRYDSGLTEHVKMLHALAAPLASKGKLVVASYGQQPQTGAKLPAKVEHYKIGDVAGMVAAIRRLVRERHRNVYVSLAVMRGDLPDSAKGTEADIIGVLGLVADFDDDDAADYARRLPVTAPYVLETSAGRFQAFLPFDQPAAVADAKPVAVALKEFAKCDHGTADMSHVWRVPGTRNWPNKRKVDDGRSAEPQTVHVVEPWDGSVISLDDIRKVLPERQGTTEACRQQFARPADPDDLPAGLIDRMNMAPPKGQGSENAHFVFCALVERGWSDDRILAEALRYEHGFAERYGGSEKAIRAEISRARDKAKGDRRDHAGSRRDAGSNGKAKGTERMDDGESAKRAYADSRKRESEQSEMPVIRIVAGELPRMVDDAEAVLIDTVAPVFQRSSMLVMVGESIIKTKRGDVKGPRMMPISAPLLLEQLNRRARFEKYDARLEDWKTVNCPANVAETYLARPQWGVRALMGIVEAPTLRWDGTVLDKPGYDDKMGLILLPGGPCPIIPDRPTKDQAASALKVLAEPLRDFPFVTDADRAVALSGMLTAVSRRAFQSAPLHAFSAPVAGTGKGKLVDVAAMMVSGRPAPVIAPGKKEEETEKRLGAALIAGDPLLSIDNVEHPLGGELLCQMLTQDLLKVRILGQSTNFEAPNNMALFATGNNLEIAGDMTRRTLLCRLDPQCERPELRQFAFDPVAQMAKDRARYIGAALTVLRAYIVAGYPGAPTPLGSFEDWSNTVRGSLLWLGQADPVDTMEAARESDPVLTDLRMLMGAWADRIGQYEQLTAAKLIERGNHVGMSGDFSNPELREALMSIAGDGRMVNSRRLSRWLKANSRRIVNGLRIMIAHEDREHGTRYRLEKKA
jgi:putative DNA primase/helicase